MNDLRLVFIQRAQKVDRAASLYAYQLDRIARRAHADFLIEHPDLAGEIKRGSARRVRGEEQDFDRLHPDLVGGAKGTPDVGVAAAFRIEANIHRRLAA